MTIHRRSLLVGLLAAPAIVRASSLMPLWVPSEILYLDGRHDDAAGLVAWALGKPVRRADGRPLTRHITQENIYVQDGLMLPAPTIKTSMTHCLIYVGKPKP